METWSSINGYKGIYEVSNIGRVKSLARVIKCPNYISMVKEIVMKSHFNGSGYKKISLINGNDRKSFYIHRLVAETFIKNINGLKEVNHKDGDKENNISSNLEWCTHSENIKHAYDNSLIPDRKGENHPRTELTNKDILNIRKLKGLFKIVEIAKKYSVSRYVISIIINKKSWKHI